MSTSKRDQLNIVKKLQRFTHGNSNELSRLLEEASMLTKVTKSCVLCAKSGRPKNVKKLSINHINKEFNNEVQADFMAVKHEGDKYEIVNISDSSTAFGERRILKS